MTIAVVQVGTGTQSPGSLTATYAFTPNTAGSTIFFIAAHTDTGGSGPTITLSDDVAGAWSGPEIKAERASQIHSSIWRMDNVPATLRNMTATASSGVAGSSSWGVCMIEATGLMLGSLDVTASATDNNSSTGPVLSGTTGTLAQGSELVICAIAASSTLTGGTFPPTGGNNAPWISIYSHPTTARYLDFNYQINTVATTGVQASWGTIGSVTIRGACIASFQAAPLAPGILMPQACY